MAESIDEIIVIRGENETNELYDHSWGLLALHLSKPFCSSLRTAIENEMRPGIDWPPATPNLFRIESDAVIEQVISKLEWWASTVSGFFWGFLDGERCLPVLTFDD